MYDLGNRTIILLAKSPLKIPLGPSPTHFSDPVGFLFRLLFSGIAGPVGACLWSMNCAVTLFESEDGWAVSCPSLPGCHSQGATRGEALENIKDAIRLWLEVANEDATQEAQEAGVSFFRELVTV